MAHARFIGEVGYFQSVPRTRKESGGSWRALKAWSKPNRTQERREGNYKFYKCGLFLFKTEY